MRHPCTTEGCTRRAAQRGLCRPCYDIRAHAGTLPAAESYSGPTLLDLADIGCSYHQIDHWTRRGWIKADNPTPGTGKRRTWDDQEIAVAARMVRLIKAGFTTPKAAEVARAPTGWLIDLAPGIRIWIEEPQPTQQEEAS